MRRYIGTVRTLAIALLSQRDGFKCQICNLNWDTLSELERKKSITIDHVDGDKNNNSPLNLRLLCRSCNASSWTGHLLRRRQHISDGLARGTSERENTQAPREEDGYSANKNFICEPAFRNWVFVMIYKAGASALRQVDLLGGGSEHAGINPSTAYRYLSKMKNGINGMLEPVRNDKEELVLIFRDRADYQLTVDKLLKKYPVDGQRYRR